MDESDRQLEHEHALLKSIRRGNIAAWGEIYDSYAPLLYRRILMPRLANPSAAEDALSETFRTAIERFDQYDAHAAGIYPWLARIAHNKAMDMHRARAITGRKLSDLSRLLAPEMEAVVGADDLLELRTEAHMLSRRAHNCLDEIKPRYKQALELRFLKDLPRERCAELMEVKVATFDVVLLRALRALRGAWAKGDA